MKPDVTIKIDNNCAGQFANGDARRMGFLPGTEWALEPADGGYLLRRVEDNLLKVYVEVTDVCNLNCRTCVRNVWEEPVGLMSDETFDRLIAQLQAMPAVQAVHFGGYGEPMAHPRIYDMLQRVKSLGLRTEMITNGTLLTEENCDKLVAANLDLVVVSIDGAREPTYDGIRLGSELKNVLKNLKNLATARYKVGKRKPDLGLSFVAMKDNLEELLELKRMAGPLRVSFILVSNLLPHTEDMRDQVLYGSLTATANPVSPHPMRRDAMVTLPRMDFTRDTTEVIRRLIFGGGNVQLAGMDWAARVRYCRFVQEGLSFVRWDGEVAPCMPLLHSYPCYVLSRSKKIKSHSFGSINSHSLTEIWDSEAYCAFRQRVRKFEFAPCVDCGGCEMSETNQEDCFGNAGPVCGDCLWAQGIIQCP